MSSRAWKTRQENDPYVRRARAEGLRARAAYKLQELAEKDDLFKQLRVVVDLGAAPGSWSQLVRRELPPEVLIVALDVLPMEPLTGVTFIQGDFREDAVLSELEAALGDRRVDLVLSDMAPNLSGIGPADQARSIHLAELTLDFAQTWLAPKGRCVVKVFQGAGFDELLTRYRQSFTSVKIRKPAASRSESREVYLVGSMRAG